MDEKMEYNISEPDKDDSEKRKKRTFWNFVDNFQGDKVILMIVLLLIAISLVTIFSSTSGIEEVLKGKATRFDMFTSQAKLACLGLGIIAACYLIPSIRLIKWASKWGFLLSATLLFCLIAGIGAGEINGAKRILVIAGKQIHIFEVIKVAMVMYLSWAIHTYKEDDFTLANRLSKRFKRLSFLNKPLSKRLMYVYLPIIIVVGGMFRGGISSSAITGMIMFATILIGGMPKKEILGAFSLMVCVIGFFVGAYFISDGEYFRRVGVAVNRLTLFKEYDIIKTANPRSQEFRDAMDKIRQPEGAKIAIMEGGILGKGPGNSTQKYSVYAISSDYMFSFIVEEFGLIFGAIPIIILYVSLLARGALIVQNCDSVFAKSAVAGLVILITGQAFLHMLINVGIGPLTGQTLPMVSHGTSSFLVFSVAFGVLLSISKMAKKQVEMRRRELEIAAAMEIQAEAAKAAETAEAEKNNEENQDREKTE